MALPTSTTNGATATINGIVYTYNSTKGAWYKQSTASTSVPVTISGTLSVSGNANVGNLGSPTVVNGNSNVTVTANGNITFTSTSNSTMVVSSTGANITGTANISGAANIGSTLGVTGNANVGNLGTAAVVATANVSTTAKYVKTTGASITGGAASGITRYPTFTATSNADIHLSSTITGNATVSQNYGITFAQGSYGTTGAIMFSENNSDGTAIGFYVSNNYGASSQLKVSIEPSGTILPGSNVAQNLGSTTLRWSTVYAGDLELSNGIGDYTIVEGEDDLFLYNNRSGKTYRFMLQEVDPAIVPPKKGT